jgi:putative ABC transport system permease protein
MVRALDKKLLRDVWRMRLHAIGVILVLACGLSVFVMAVGMRGSLERTRAQYYAERKMADLAVSVVRAPQRLVNTLAGAPGVAIAEDRIAGMALLDLSQIDEPASARLVSLPRVGRPRVNDLTIARGRWPDASRADEVLVNEAFATALGLNIGDTLAAVMHGRRQILRVVGFANSPEFVFVSAPGELFPQPERFGVIWMSREAMERAYDLGGSFNEVVFRLGRGADQRRTIEAIDRIAAPYGSNGAYGRDRMMSDRFLTEELHQLATMAAFLPVFFLIVAAFLVNISLGRVIATERSNIGLLKAFGYSHWDVAWHYAKSALLFALIGGVLGSAAGIWFGRAVAAMYRQYYHFPSLEFSASPATFAAAWGAGITAAALGAVVSVWQAARLAPAEALAAPKPAAFSGMRGWIADLGERLDAKNRIILRRIARFPRRAATTTIGVALAIALLVVARAFPAVMDRLLDVHFNLANRQDVTLSFVEPRETGVLFDVQRLPGVIYAEPFRADAVILQNAQHRVQEAIIGVPQDAALNRLIGADRRVIAPPLSGIVLARGLAAKLNAHPGDEIVAEETGGRRIVARVRVSGIVEPMIGSSAYMDLNALEELMREPGRISGAHVRLDSTQYHAFNLRLKATPALAGASFVRLAERSMRNNFNEHVGVMILIYSAFAAVMAGGVAFSAARVTLAEQQRDLATLRVLGFTRAEASYVLVAEIAVLALLAIPLGCGFGTLMGMWMMRLFETDMYAFPYVYNAQGYAFAVAFTLACVAIASLIVRRDVDRLDMVGVLKARD